MPNKAPFANNLDAYTMFRVPRSIYILQKHVGTHFVEVFATIFLVAPSMARHLHSTIHLCRFYRRAFSCSTLRSVLMAIAHHKASVRSMLMRRDICLDRPIDFRYVGYEALADLMRNKIGLIIVTAPVGDRLLLPYALALGDETFCMVTHSAAKVYPSPEKLEIIAEQPDMSHHFAINAALSGGKIAVIAADADANSSRTFECDVLGTKYRISQYPFLQAALNKSPIFFATVIPTASDTYTATIVRLDSPSAENIDTRAQKMADKYFKQFADAITAYPTHYRSGQY